jgi:hypothetical protein
MLAAGSGIGQGLSLQSAFVRVPPRTLLVMSPTIAGIRTLTNAVADSPLD